MSGRRWVTGLGSMIEAQSVVEDGLAAASRGGADGCIVLVDETSHADVRFALNTTTTNGVRRDRTVTVVAVAAGAVGVSRRSGVVDVEGMVSAALTDAQGAPPAEDAFPLVDGMGAAGGGGAASSVAFGRSPVETDLSALGNVLSGLSGAFGRARERDVVLAGFAEFGVSTLYLGSSTGVRLSFSQPTGSVNLVGRSADGARSAWTGAGAEHMERLAFPEMEAELWRRLDWARRPISLDAGRYEVILPPSGVSDLMGSLNFYALGGQDAEDGRTVFSSGTNAGGTRVGEQISTLPFTLYSDPFEPGLECLPFVASAHRAVRRQSSTTVCPSGGSTGSGTAVLRTCAITGPARRARASRWRPTSTTWSCGPRTTGGTRPGVTNGGTVDDMVSRTERGLLLTCLWYIREVDPATLLLTGLTRDGVYVVENGEVVGAANNFRFNESPVDLLARATEVGTSVRALGRELGEYLNRCVMPPLRIPDFNMSSVSQAS